MSKQVSNKRIYEILSNARKLMNDEGKHWLKGRLSRKKKIGMCYCSIGAIRAAADNLAEARAASDVLGQHGLGFGPTKRNSYYYGRAAMPFRGSIETWNDDPRTTWQDVDRAFRKAIRKVR